MSDTQRATIADNLEDLRMAVLFPWVDDTESLRLVHALGDETLEG